MPINFLKLAGKTVDVVTHESPETFWSKLYPRLIKHNWGVGYKER